MEQSTNVADRLKILQNHGGLQGKAFAAFFLTKSSLLILAFAIMSGQALQGVYFLTGQCQYLWIGWFKLGFCTWPI